MPGDNTRHNHPGREIKKKIFKVFDELK